MTLTIVKLHTLEDFQTGQRVEFGIGTRGTVVHVDPIDDEPLPWPIGVQLDAGPIAHFQPQHLRIIRSEA